MLKPLEKIDTYFLFVLFTGTILRIISLIITPIGPDFLSFVNAARGIISFNYYTYGTFRPPGFPITIVPFLLLTKNNFILSSKLASFFTSIILIYYSYYIFTAASKKFYNKDDEKIEYKAKLIGLIVSYLISLNLYFVVNTGRGLREDLLALLFILAFYFTIIKEKMEKKDILYLIITISLLTLTLLSAGIFFAIGIILFYFISKLKYFEFEKMSLKKLLIVLLTVFSSFSFWALFSAFTIGDPLYNFQVQGAFFKDYHNLEFSSIENIIDAAINAIIFGIPFEVYYLFLIISLIFTFLVFYIIIKNYEQKQILFIIIIIVINFLYISIFMAPSKTLAIPNHPRVIMYFFLYVFYMGSIPLGKILFEYQKKKNINTKNMNFVFICFLITYSLQGLIYWFDYQGFPPPIHPLLLILFLSDEVFLLIFLIKSRHIDYIMIDESQ